MFSSSRLMWRRSSSSVLAASALLAFALASTPRAQCGDEAVLHSLDAGTAAPVLRTPKGAAVIGGGFSLRVFDAAPSSTGFLLYSAFENPTFDPVLGATIWPATPWLVKSFGTSAKGVSGAQFNTSVVTDDLCGAFATFQAVVADAGAPGGFTVSNAVRLRVGSVNEPVFAPVEEPALVDDIHDVQFVDVYGDGVPDMLVASPISFHVIRGLPAGGFGTLQSYGVLGGGTRVPLLADMNGDGITDLVVVEDDVGIVLLDAVGGVLAATNHVSAGFIADGAIGDVDQDGILDVVTLESGDVAWWKGTGSGALLPRQDIDVGLAAASAVELAHMDHDGVLDLVYSTTKTVVALGNGDGTFVALPPVGPVGLGLLSVLDLDGDGELDVTGFSGKVLGVQRGNGDGTLQSFQGHVAAAAFVKDHVFADLDGDGRLDLIAIPGHISVENVFVSAGLAAGAFAPAVEYGGIHNPRALAVLDEDLDGALDVVVFGASSTLTLPGTGDGALRAPVVIVVGKGPSEAIVADLDGNGLDDVVVLNESSDDFSVILVTSSGPILSGSFPTTSRPQTLVAGDFDGDQILDVMTSDSSLTDVRAFAGNGSGGFGAPIVTPTPFQVSHIMPADFDEDGILDVGVSTASFDSAVLLGNGDGTFSAGVALPPATGRMAATGRLNGDAHIDIVLYQPLTDALSVLLGNGDGTFVAVPQSMTGLGFVQVADVDLDGHQDLLGAHFSPGSGDEEEVLLQVLLGVGDGTFVFSDELHVGTFPGPAGFLGLTVSDFDENGIPDVVVSDRGGEGLEGNIRWLRGNGDGTFTTGLQVPAGAVTSNAVAGHFDGDGIRDVASFDSQSNQFSVHLPGRVWFHLNQVGE